MTLNNLRKTVSQYRELLSSVTPANEQQLQHLKGLPFYDWSQLTSTLKFFSFNHVIGLPQKYGVAYPLFDYEQMLFDALQANKHVWIKKATGLGVTEFMLRYMAWLCLNTKSLSNSQMCIVTGPRIELAITLIDRMKCLFTNGNVQSLPFINKEHKHMLAHCKELMEYHKGSIAISPKHTKLITSLRAAVEKGDGSLDKDATSHDDLFDAFRLTLQFWH